MMQGEYMHVIAKRIRNKLIKTQNAKQFVCKTKDNVSIAGLYIERKNPIGTMIFCHGYKCCKELTAEYIDMFSQFNAVLFDFRSHGENKKTATTIGCHEHQEILAVIDWINKNKPQLKNVPTIILGISMGGAAALRASENNPSLCDALVIDSSFSSLKSVIQNTFANKSGLPSFPFLPIMETMFNFICKCEIAEMQPVKSITKIRQPLLLIHSCIDKIIPVQESLLMYAQAAGTGAKLWIAPKCKHGWLHKKYPELYKKKILKFLKKHINLNA
jgi:alpha-beta hydrolase superfamily lysophospholipase